jgi:hypothetical protein
VDKDDAIDWLWRKRMWVVLRHLVKRDGPKRFLLAKLLGKTSVEHLYENLTEEDQQTCLALMGPHGYSIYRMLLAQRGLEDHDYVPESYDREQGLRANRTPL